MSAPASVNGTFDFYFGNMMTVTKQEYLELFGEECKDNCFFVKYAGADGESLKSALLDTNRSYSGHVYTESVSDQTAKAESLKSLFDNDVINDQLIHRKDMTSVSEKSIALCHRCQGRKVGSSRL